MISRTGAPPNRSFSPSEKVSRTVFTLPLRFMTNTLRSDHLFSGLP